MKKCLLIVLFVLLPMIVMAQGRYRVVNTSELNVRNKPSAKSTRVGKLNRGDEVTVYSITNGWAQIDYKSNKRYVSIKYLEKVADEKAPKPETTKHQTSTKRTQSSQGRVTSRTSSQHFQSYNVKIDDGFVDKFSFFVYGFGGMSTFLWSDVSPEYAISYGGGAGVRWASIRKPKYTLFSDLTFEYEHVGCNAYPIDYVSIHLYPIGYSYNFNSKWGLLAKIGGYFAYPISGDISSYGTSIDYGVACGIGLRMKCVELIGSVNYGLADVSNAPVELKNFGFTAGVSYMFHLK